MLARVAIGKAHDVTPRKEQCRTLGAVWKLGQLRFGGLFTPDRGDLLIDVTIAEGLVPWHNQLLGTALDCLLILVGDAKRGHRARQLDDLPLRRNNAGGIVSILLRGRKVA